MLQSLDTLIAFVLIMTVASLFVTVLVQMGSAALSLRGKNLANALALTFQTVAPTLGPGAHRLAAHILCDPLLSDSTRTPKDEGADPCASPLPEKPWHFTDIFGATRLASAVRPEEVYAALRRLAQERPGINDRGVAAAAQQVLAALIVPDQEAAAIRAQLGGLRALLEEIPDAALQGKLVDTVENMPANFLVAADAAREKFERWFGTAQDRAQQWFQLHTRGLTIAASALLALFLQLDAVEIFHHASTNAAAREALVAQAARAVVQADAVGAARPALLARVADEWARENERPPISLDGISNAGELRAALAQAAAGQFDPAQFERLLAAGTRADFAEKREQIAEMTREVSATGFEFIPVGYWRWPGGASFGERVAVFSRHLPGMALFAALLTLGAPYWYNLLKNLTSLRPALAQLIGREENARPPAS